MVVLGFEFAVSLGLTIWDSQSILLALFYGHMPLEDCAVIVMYVIKTQIKRIKERASRSIILH